MALNLVRNSRVFFTTNVNSSTGVINSSGFSTLNTQEIQVLDGFTFSQNTNSETVTLSEAGSDPIRGQRAFNTSLAPVDFSFSTYVRPSNAGSYITAEEAGLWNVLLSSEATTSYTITNVTGVTYTISGSTAIVTIAGSSMAYGSIAAGDIITLTGLSTSTAGDGIWVNAPCKVTSVSGSSIVATVINPKPALAAISISAFTGTLTVYKSAWVPATSSYSTVTTATSNKNQLQRFGMIFIVDNVTYAVDNCAMNDVTVDFGLDSIATLAWKGQATVLRDASSSISLSGGGISVTGTAVTGLTSTDNIFIGQTITATGGTGTLAASTTVTTITGSTSLTISQNASVNGSLTGVKIIAVNATGTLAAPTGTGPWVSALSSLASTSGISVGDSITATGAPWGTGTAVVSAVVSATALTVTFTGGAAPTAGAVTTITATIANLSSATALTAAAKITSAPFITNKLSTVTFTTLNALGNAAATSYSIALTGGSVMISNNISYVTPANLGIVNVPAVSYTGTRAISGTMNAYLKTGSGVGSTGQLLADMLAAAASTTEPMAAVSIALGGSGQANRVVFDMPSVTFSVPTIDVQQVVSTAIKFTAEGSLPSATTNGNTFAVDSVNDLTVRYYAA